MSNELVMPSTAINTQGRSSITLNQQLQVKDTTVTATLAPMRPSQFLEEKRWPPLDIMNNHPYWKKNLHDNFSNNTCDRTSLRPAEVSFGNNTRSRENISNINNDHNYFNSSKIEFDPPFRIKVTLITICYWNK
jgi:hypothetical protein